jgi:exonuclease SbcD
MKILHTSDLHIGKRLSGIDRLDEQRAVIDEIRNIAKDEKVDLIIIAGDIFDTSVPSSQAYELFCSSMTRLAKVAPVVIIAGNHDDPIRLASANQWAAACNIVLCGDCKNIASPKGFSAFAGYIGTNINGEDITLALLPYPSDSRMAEEIIKDQAYHIRVKKWLEACCAGFSTSTINILSTHLFSAGSQKEGSEVDIELGTAKIIPLDCYPNAHYTALGHIHKPQFASKSRNIYYSGAIMQYTFGEESQEKSVAIVDLDKAGVKNFKTIALKTSKQLIRLEATTVTAALDLLSKNTNNIVELTLRVSEPSLPLHEVRQIKEYSNCVFVPIFPSAQTRKQFTQGRSDEQIFIDFYKQKNADNAPDPQLVQLFLELLQ